MRGAFSDFVEKRFRDPGELAYPERADSQFGLLLLLSALVPLGEGWICAKERADWQFPSGVYWTAWILLAAGYSYSGWMKLLSPSWIDGSALSHILNNPLARPGWARDILLQLPDLYRQIATWAALIVELLFLPLSFCLTTRKVAWLAMIGLHIAILCVVNFGDLTLAMLLVHFFTFHPQWVWPTAERRSFQAEAGSAIARKAETA